MTLSYLPHVIEPALDATELDEELQDTLARIGCRLRQLRTDRGLTLREVSLQSRIAASSLSRIETGMRAVSLPQLIVLSTLYDASLDELAA